jgi:hypothetical protein
VFSSVFNLLTDFALFVCMCCQRQDFVHQDVGGNSVPSIQATKFGAALKAVPKLSKHLVAYTEGLLAVSPYVKDPPASNAQQPAVNADEPAPAAADQEEATEAGAFWWRRRRWVCTQLVKRFDPNSTPGEHRSERRTGTAQCHGCIAPYLEADSRKALITP